jgi:hypothetical protein
MLTRAIARNNFFIVYLLMFLRFHNTRARVMTQRIPAPMSLRYFMLEYISMERGEDAKSNAPASKPSGTLTDASSG